MARHRKDDAPITADNVQAVRDTRIDTSPKAEQVSEADLIDAPQEPVRKRPAARKQAAPPVERKEQKAVRYSEGRKMIRKESSDRVCAFCGAPATTEYKGVVCCGKCREKACRVPWKKRQCL